MRVPARSIVTKVIVGCLVVVAALAQAGERREGAPVLGEERSGQSAPRFRIRGSIGGLFPGLRTTMRLAVRNPNPYAIRVTRIKTAVGASTGACPARSMKVRTWKGRARVPARGVRRIKVSVRMKRTAPTVCAGHRYRLIYRGWAVRA